MRIGLRRAILKEQYLYKRVLQSEATLLRRNSTCKGKGKNLNDSLIRGTGKGKCRKERKNMMCFVVLANLKPIYFTAILFILKKAFAPTNTARPATAA